MKFLLPLFLFPALASARPLTVNCESAVWLTKAPEKAVKSQLYFWGGEGYANFVDLNDERERKAEFAIGIQYDKENNYHFFVERVYRADSVRMVRLSSAIIPAPTRGMEIILRAQGDFAEPAAAEPDFQIEMKCKYGNS